MRYFFRVIDEPEEDEDGVEFENLDAAKLHALHHVRDILSDHHLSKSLCEALSMEVTDERGQSVYRVNFSAASPASPRTP